MSPKSTFLDCNIPIGLPFKSHRHHRKSVPIEPSWDQAASKFRVALGAEAAPVAVSAKYHLILTRPLSALQNKKGLIFFDPGAGGPGAPGGSPEPSVGRGLPEAPVTSDKPEHKT